MVDISIPFGFILSLFIFIIGAISRLIDSNFGKKGWLWILSGATIFLTAEVLLTVIDWRMIGLYDIVLLISRVLNIFGIFFVIVGMSKIIKELISGSQ